MAAIVHSSFGRKYRSREMAALHGFALTDVVIPSTTRLVEDSEGNLATGALGAFNHASTTGLDVVIDTGEAVVAGAYLAIDTQTTITLPASATTTIYVGWQDGVADNVIIGPSGDFTADDPKTAIWDFTTDSTTVTGTTDQRNTDDFRIENENVQALVNFTSDESFTGYPLGDADVEIDEEIRDVIGAALAGGTNITITVDDAGDTITIDGTDTQRSQEEIEDIVGALIAGGTNITATYDDAGDTLTIDTDALDAEQVEDQVNSLLVGGTGITLTYDDAGGSLTIDGHSRYTDSEARAAVDGLKFTQSTEPTVEEGEFWLDTSAGILYAAYDAGNGVDWHPVPPVTVLNEAATFAESDVTVTHNDTEIVSESVRLGNDLQGTEISKTLGDGSETDHTELGFTINPNRDLTGIEVDVSTKSTVEDSVKIKRVSDGTVLASGGTPNIEGDTVTLMADMSAGSKYAVYLNDDHGFLDANYTTDVSDTSSDFDIVNGWKNGSEHTRGYALTRLQAIYDATSGDALVEWSPGVPDDIKSWDLATFQRTLAGETVTIDVEAPPGTLQHSDIDENFDISTIAETSEVAIRANISRASTSNNPSVDYAARRSTR